MTRCTNMPNVKQDTVSRSSNMVMDPAVKSGSSNKKRKMVQDPAVRNVDRSTQVKTKKKYDTPITRRELSSDPHYV